LTKRSRMHRVGKVTALTSAAVVLTATAATGHVATFDDGAVDSGKETHAHDAQHGGEEGHIDVANYGLELVSKLGLKNVEPGKIADVGVLGNHAYLAAWGGQTCKYNGVHVVDISDVTAPKEIAFVPSKEGSYPGEGVQALPVSTSAFTGDILVTNNEQCKPGVGVGGVNLYDVTVPSRPTPLVVGYGDDSADAAGAANKSAHEIHSAFAWDAGDRAFVVIVDNEEGADVDILDISNPRKPVMVAEYDLDEQFPQITDHLGTGSSFLHDMVVKEIGGRQIMLASYWDGGYVTLDVTDPANATLVADSDFPLLDPEAAESGLSVKPEGNAHQAEFSRDNRYIVAADEDFSPVSVLSKTAAGDEFDATVGSNTHLEQGDALSGVTRFVGGACAGLDPTTDTTEIALIERGACTFSTKIANAQSAGYAAAVVFNNTTECAGLVNMSSDGPDIPAFFVGRDTAFGLMGIGGNACVPVPDGELGTLGQGISVSAVFDGWGYVHLYKSGGKGGKLTELDTYAVPEAHDPAMASGFGDLSVHEVAMSQQKDGLGYVSYYAAGVRVIDVSSGKIVEKGAYIDEGGNNFWGIEAFTAADGQEYIAASDRDLGLYLFKHTPTEPTRPGGGKPGKR
jgi:hypothetical protein